MRARAMRTRAAVAATAAALLVLPIAAQAAPGGGNGQGGGPPGGETTGNNLAVPVIWAGEERADGSVYQLALRGTELDPSLIPPFQIFTEAIDVDLDGTLDPAQTFHVYPQKTDSTWQAENAFGSEGYYEADGKVHVDLIDWGDNLESRDWRLGGIVRVETALFKAAPMTGYLMRYLSGQGKTEVWGVRASDADQALTYSTGAAAVPADRLPTVYSGAARLTIQKINPADAADLVWDAAQARWEYSDGSSAGTVVLSRAAYQQADGPGNYSGEINVSGKVIFGYVWNTKHLADGEGEYRLTLSIDPSGVDVIVPDAAIAPNLAGGPRATLTDASILVPVEGEIAAEAEPLGNQAQVDGDVTWIDVGLTKQGGGGGGGGPRR